MYAWLTPDAAPSGNKIIRLHVPVGEEWEAAIRGALAPLLFEENWEQFGSFTPEQAVETILPTINQTIAEWSECEETNVMVIPIGATIPFALENAPSGWILCDGASLIRAEHTALFNAIGVSFGAVDSSHFNLPDIKGRTVFGAGIAVGGSQLDFAVGGGEGVTDITGPNLPSHRHTTKFTRANFAAGGTPALTGEGAGVDLHTEYFGQNQPLSNMPPYLVLNWFIYEGE